MRTAAERQFLPKFFLEVLAESSFEVHNSCRDWPRNHQRRHPSEDHGFNPERFKARSTYFFTHNGERSGFVVFDLKEPSQIPLIAEPLFAAFNAKVEFHPAMNVEDLKKAQSGIDKAVKKYQRAA